MGLLQVTGTVYRSHRKMKPDWKWLILQVELLVRGITQVIEVVSIIVLQEKQCSHNPMFYIGLFHINVNFWFVWIFPQRCSNIPGRSFGFPDVHIWNCILNSPLSNSQHWKTEHFGVVFSIENMSSKNRLTSWYQTQKSTNKENKTVPTCRNHKEKFLNNVVHALNLFSK